MPTLYGATEMSQSSQNPPHSWTLAAKGTLAGLSLFACCSASGIEILNTSTIWTYLNPTDATDPATSDADFHSTWFTAAYNDSSWSSGSNEFGYGTIDAFGGAPTTDIGTPAAGDRYTAYFRTEFTTAQDFNALSLSLLADDAAVIYLDGVRIGSWNYESGSSLAWTFSNVTADTYTGEGLDSDGTETAPDVIDLSSLSTLSAGSHVLAVSIHQAGQISSSFPANQSSDLGFQALLDGTAVPEPSEFALFFGLSALGLAIYRRKRCR